MPLIKEWLSVLKYLMRWNRQLMIWLIGGNRSMRSGRRTRGWGMMTVRMIIRIAMRRKSIRLCMSIMRILICLLTKDTKSRIEWGVCYNWSSITFESQMLCLQNMMRTIWSLIRNGTAMHSLISQRVTRRTECFLRIILLLIIMIKHITSI